LERWEWEDDGTDRRGNGSRDITTSYRGADRVLDIYSRPFSGLDAADDGSSIFLCDDKQRIHQPLWRIRRVGVVCVRRRWIGAGEDVDEEVWDGSCARFGVGSSRCGGRRGRAGRGSGVAEDVGWDRRRGRRRWRGEDQEDEEEEEEGSCRDIHHRPSTSVHKQ